MFVFEFASVGTPFGFTIWSDLAVMVLSWFATYVLLDTYFPALTFCYNHNGMLQ
jgi:hypothetical protein